MTILNIYIGQPKPGRYEDALEMNRASKKLLERHGAKEQRNLVAAVSGGAYGSIVNSCELDDIAAWGAFYDAVMADEEILSMMAQLQGANSPYASESVTTALEIPLGVKAGTKGRILSARVSAPHPGRHQAAIALGGQLAELMMSHGARRCRLFSQQATGALPDVLVSTTEFDTMAAYGKTVNSLVADPALQQMLELVRSTDSPVRPITSDIYTEIA